jgi:hypothetical protein
MNGLLAMQRLHAQIPRGLAPGWSSASDVELALATEQALTEGGDARIALGAGGLNPYACAPRPDAALVALGSSTASVVSAAGFDAARVLHARLRAHPQRWHAETERIRHEIHGFTGAALVAGSEVVLAASGTDVHLIALHLAAAGRPEAVQAVMIDSAETGSGVGAALAGHHFAETTCLGASVQRGTPLAAGLPWTRPQGGSRPAEDRTVAPQAIALRHADGTLRDAVAVDADFAAAVTRCVQAGRRCLLVLADASKTGVMAPSMELAAACAARHPGQVEVLVDACQFRLAAESIAAYLARGFMVAVTGSKFVTGPAFSGALLLPPALVQRLRALPLAALHAYSSRSHWPAGWAGASGLREAHNLGLLLRWEAALAELRAFAAVPAHFVEAFLVRWSGAVGAMLDADAHFERVPVRAPRRDAAGWDAQPSILPFVVRGPLRDGAARPLDRTQAVWLHRELQVPTRAGGALRGPRPPARFQLGQPVQCGVRGDTPVSALRLCASARMIAAAWRDQDAQAEAAINDCAAALARIAVLVDGLAA